MTLGGEALYDQEVAVGAGAPGWQSSAVTSGRRAFGSVLIVDPEHGETPTTTVSDQFPDTAVMSLGDQATLIASAAPDAIELDRRLSAALA